MTLSLTRPSDHVITRQLATRLTAVQAGMARVEAAHAETSNAKAGPVPVCDEKTCPYCCGPETD